MGRTLLIGGRTGAWREWLRTNRKGRDLICLDPAEPNYGTPGRLVLVRGDKTVAWRFFGSLDPMRSPHTLIAATMELGALADEDAIILSFPYRPTPLLRQTAYLLAELTRPTAILIESGQQIPLNGWPLGPEDISLEGGFPEVVLNAQRKAQWLALLQMCNPHEVDLRNVSILGTRLGSGQSVTESVHKLNGFKTISYAEVCGKHLFVVAEDEPDAPALSHALDNFHCEKATIVAPSAYRYLLCSFARESGEDFGMGIIREIEWDSFTATVTCNAIPPAPVRILKIGSQRVDADGKEMGELRPWQV